MHLRDETGQLWTLHIWYEPPPPEGHTHVLGSEPPRRTVTRVHAGPCPDLVAFPADKYESPRFCTTKLQEVFWGLAECRWPDQFARRIGRKLAFARALAQDPAIMDKAKRTALWASFLRGGERPDSP